MPVTPQRKYELLKQVGIDPDKYWIDDSGNVIDLPKDNSAMAGIKTAALNLPRTAAGVGGAALGAAGAGALGLPTGPGAVAAGLAGGFGGAALGSTIGEAIQNAVYPDDVLMAQQARSVRNPGAVQLGDLASQAVFFRPSFNQLRDAGRGLRALTTTPGFAKLRPAQTGAFMDVGTGGVIEAGSTMAQGGDLSEILKNAAIGAVFSNPTGITKTMTRDVFSPHVADQGLRDVVNPADLLVKPGEPAVEKPREVNPELLKAFMKQQKTDAKLAEQLAALKANQEAAAKKAQIEAEQGIGFDQPLPAQDFTLPPNLNSVEARFLRSQAVEPDVEVTLDPQTKPQPKPPVIIEPGTPGALDQELGIRTTQPFFDWWAKNADENYRTRMTQGRPTGAQGQEVAGVTEGTRGPDGKRNITVNKEAYTDTAPHELTHGMILDVLQHGKKGEQAEMRRLLKLAGVDEEAFVQGVGEDVVRRFMAGATTTKTTDAGTTTTTAPGMDDSWRSDFVSFMKYKFGKASPEDVRRIMSNTMLRGGGPKGVSRIVAKPTQEVEEKPPVMPEPTEVETSVVNNPARQQDIEAAFAERDRVDFDARMKANMDKLPVSPLVAERNARAAEDARLRRQKEDAFNERARIVRERMRAEDARDRANARSEALDEFNRTRSVADEEGSGTLTPEERMIADAQRYIDIGGEPSLADIPLPEPDMASDLATARSDELVGQITPEEYYAAEDAKIRRLEEEAAALRRRRDFPRAVKQAEGNPAPERGERLLGSERRGREREVKKALRSADLENADLSNVGREEVRESTKAEFTNKMKQGRVVSENARESAADLEARRIEARLAGDERPRYQEFGKDRDTVLRRASDNGYTVGPIYHGTRASDISVFRKKESGIWAAFDKQNATPGSGDAPRNVLNLVADPGPRPYTLSPEELGAWRRSLNPLNFVRDIRYKHNATSVKVGDYAIVVFKPEQLKSADSITYDDAGNPIPLEQRFDRESKDVRYQQFGPNRPTSGLADPVGRRDFSPFESASQKAARSDNPVIRTVGRALTELFPAQRAMRGKYRALPEAFANLNEKDKDLLYKILIDEYRAGQPAPGTVPARLRKEYNDVRRTLRQMRDDQIKAGQRNSNGVVPGIDNSYFPNVVDPSVRKTLADEIDSPRFKQLKDEFVKFNEANLRSKNYSAAKANEEANKLFNRFIGTLNKQPVEGAFDFGAVVLPEASRLPDNWLHSDPAEAMSQYVRDWSRSRTFHDIVQTNEDVMAGLGQEEFFVNGKKTPVKNRVATPAVKDNNILFLLNEAIGIRRGSQDKITGAIGRAASAAWLANPITRSVDIATSLFKGLGMVTPAQIPGLVSNLRNLGKSYERAHDTGWIREDGNTIVGEVLGAGEAFSNGVDKFSKGLSKYTGSEKLENFGRGLSQNIGEYIARTNTALAQSGNKRATDFLDRVAPNWRTLSEAELGTRIGQLFQGRYDATNLPQWLSDSPAAPFFSLARWNIEQWNNFREFAIKPARNGDPVPLISMLVAGIAGGVGIKEIREALSGRKSKIATLKEIAEAPEGSAKYKEAVRYLGNLAQLTGTMGIVSEMSNWGLDIASKDMPAAASMPALEVTRDIIPRLIAAGNAMMDGEDPLTVITQVSRDIGNEHMSAYRFIEGNLGRAGVWNEAGEDLADANARRDLRVGKRLRGEPIKAAVQLPIDYSRAEERAVEKERDPVKMREMARELKADIMADPDKDNRARRMRSAAASRPSYMPSKENDPKAFKEQLDFVRRTQGPEKAEDLRLRYLRDKRNADKRRQMFN